VITQYEELRRIAGWELKEVKLNVAFRISENGRLIIEGWGQEHRGNLRYSKSRTQRQGSWGAAYEHHFGDGSSVAVWGKTGVTWNEARIAYNFSNGIWVELRRNTWDKKAGTERDTVVQVNYSCSFADLTRFSAWQCWSKGGLRERGKESVTDVVARTNREFRSSSTLHRAESQITETVLTDLNALMSLVWEGRAKVEADYTIDTWAVFSAALLGAENYLQNTPTNEKTQNKTNEFYNDLKKAMDDLEKKPVFDAPKFPSSSDTVSFKHWSAPASKTYAISGNIDAGNASCSIDVPWLTANFVDWACVVTWWNNLAALTNTIALLKITTPEWTDSMAITIKVEETPIAPPTLPTFWNQTCTIWWAGVKLFNPEAWVTYEIIVHGSPLYPWALSLTSEGYLICNSGFPVYAYSISIKATNAWGTTTSNPFGVACQGVPTTPPTAPTITDKIITVWDSVNLFPLAGWVTYSLENDPGWAFSFNSSNGNVTCNVAGNYPWIRVRATNAWGTVYSNYFDLTCEAPAIPPSIWTVPSYTWDVWDTISINYSSYVTNPNNPTLTCSWLPAGLAISWLTISWTPTTGWTGTCTLSDWSASSSFNFTINAAPNNPPVWQDYLWLSASTQWYNKFNLPIDIVDEDPSTVNIVIDSYNTNSDLVLSVSVNNTTKEIEITTVSWSWDLSLKYHLVDSLWSTSPSYNVTINGFAHW